MTQKSVQAEMRKHIRIVMAGVHMSSSKYSIVVAQNLARDLFQIQASAQALPGEFDANFHLRAVDGSEYLLKVATDATEDRIIDLQNSVLNFLAVHQSALAVPKVLASACTSKQERVRLFSFLPGTLLGTLRFHSKDLLYSIGRGLGELDRQLSEFQHPAARRDLKWDIMNASWVQKDLHLLKNDLQHQQVAAIVQDYEMHLKPLLKTLRKSVIHGDMNDYNILVKTDSIWRNELAGFIDFGDLHESVTIAELAIAATYLMLDKVDPLEAATHLVQGYHEKFPLTEKELTVLFPLIQMRLCTSVVNSARQKILRPEDPYVVISEKPAWDLLDKMSRIHPRFALYTFRKVCGMTPCPLAARLEELYTPPSQSSVGGYNEARLIYTSADYQVATNDGYEGRSIHLGHDLACEPGTPILGPLRGRVHSLKNNGAHQDYGPTIIIQHDVPGSSDKFYTLYGHLSLESLTALSVGQEIEQGQTIGSVGSQDVNGGWPPHLHFQVILDLFAYEGNFPGVALPSQRAVWLSICPDPTFLASRLLGKASVVEGQSTKPQVRSEVELLELRRAHLGKSLGLSYRQPLHIVRGIQQYLYDQNGRQFLDGVNNVCHVGHCHPRVVAAGQAQMALLNTNTRYLYDGLPLYAERLAATLPHPLEVCFFVCSGSEANELALRLARAHTQRKDMIVVDAGYHGNTSALIDVSPYKFQGPGGSGKPDHVHILDLPDTLRRPDRVFADQIDEILHAMRDANRTPAAFLCESLLSCGGQIVLPEGYLQRVYAAVRKAGGVCIADEVQVGLGRIGTHFWGFESQGVVPDIVTIGKPLGNGHPMAAVVTTRAIAESFANGMEYFNTFGGNPVSCAIGMSVLDVLAEERLQAHAHDLGLYLKSALSDCKTRHPVVADVRGLGLFLGVELVQDSSLVPAPDYAHFVVERMRARGVLLSTDGPFHNVIKIKPPLVFTRRDAEVLVDQFERVLTELS